MGLRTDFRQHGFLRPAWLGLQNLARKCGFAIVYGKVSNIPDSRLYFPFFQPWRSAQWQTKLRTNDPHSLVTPEAKYVLYSHAADAIIRCPGDVAECGVYKGGTARLLAGLAQEHRRRIFLFDTFAGMPSTDPDKDLHKEGDFSDTSLAAVQRYLSDYGNIEYYPGRIPDTLKGLEDRRFCFVHIDLDIYAAISEATKFFYPLTSSGGIIVYDDYGYPSCPGARAAVEEFYRDKPEVLLVLSTGQCVVRKL